MCLSRVTETYDPALDGIEAWKMFILEPDTGRLSSPYFSIRRGHEALERRYYSEGEWHDAGPEEVAMGSKPPYKAGFHAYANKVNAQDDLALAQYYFSAPLVIRRVKLRGVHTSGVEGISFKAEYKCYVAQEMMLLPTPASGAGEKS